MTRPIRDLDVPRTVLEQQLRDLVARQRAEIAALVAAPCELCDAPTTQPEPTHEEAL